MIAGANPKGEQKKRLTQKRAAEMLNVTPWYLNRVIRGHIKSVRLSKRLAELQFVHPNPPGDPTQPAQPDPAMNENSRFPTGTPDAPSTTPHPGHFEPAWDNFSEAWLESVSKLGFAVICIQFKSCPLGYEQAEFITSLGAHFASAGLGHFDSSQWQGKILHFFYANAKRLPEALEFLEAKLAQHDLLPISGIGYMDNEASLWRTFFPRVKPTPQ